MTADNQKPNVENGEQMRNLALGGVEALTAKPGPQAYYDQSWAVVIGINDYQGQHPSLANAKNDAQAVAQILKESYGFEHVVTMYDQEATQDAILNCLRDELPAQVGPNDRVVFFFAGHGTTREGRRGYLIPQDAEQSKYADYVDMAELRGACEWIKAKHIFIVLDCCFSGVAAIASRAAPQLPPRVLTDVYLQRITEQGAWQILTAGASDELAADSGTRPGHSAFTSALLAGLEGQADENGDGIITASELANFVKPEVTRDSFGTRAKGQTPFFNYLGGSGQGDLVFLRPGQEIKVEPASPLAREVQPLLKQYPWLWAVGAGLLVVTAALAWFAWSGMQASQSKEAQLAAIVKAATATQSAMNAQATAAAAAAADAPGSTQTAVSVQLTALADQNATALAVTLTALAAAGPAEPTQTPTATPTQTPTSTSTPTPTPTRRTPPPVAYQCMVTDQIGDVSLRAGPDASSKLLGLLKPGDKLTVSAWASDPSGRAWFGVMTADQKGWIIGRPYPDLGRDYDCNFDPAGRLPFPQVRAPTPTDTPTPTPTPVAVLIARSRSWMDRTEVTNQQYGECVTDRVCTRNASGYNALFYQDTYPVVGVTWQQARTYCKWREGRLPLLKEWLLAASLDGRPYPWGSASPSCDLAVIRDCGQSHPLAVGSRPKGATAEGILDLIGNVWEWTGDEGIGGRDDYVVLGGSWADGTSKDDIEHFIPKNSDLFLAQGKDYQSDNQGFRCVYDKAPAVP